MNAKYKVEENDYLTVCLFSESKNPVTKSRRKKALILLIVLYALLAVFFYDYDLFAFYVFLVVAPVGVIFYRFYLERNMYKKIYLKNIRQNFYNRIGQTIEVKFEKEFMEILETNASSQVKYIRLECIEEIQNYYFFKMTTGERILLPKRAVYNKSVFSETINSILNSYNIELKKELDWNWK